MKTNRSFMGIEMPDFVGEWFTEKYESDSYDYMDNYRWAPEDDPVAMGKFDDAEARGCCGSHNETITAPDGSKWRVGFNYGH